MPAYFWVTYMSKNSVGPATHPQPSRQEAADLINEAFKKSDVAKFVMPLAPLPDLAQKSGLARPSLCSRSNKTNFTTVFNVLDAMGFQLHVTVRRDAGAARLKSVESCEEPER